MKVTSSDARRLSSSGASWVSRESSTLVNLEPPEAEARSFPEPKAPSLDSKRILTEVWVRLEVDPVSSLGWPRPGRTLRRTHDQQQPIGAGECAPPGCAPWPEDRVAVILTPDQQVRVFISSTLEELAAARREIRRLHRFRCGMSPEPAPPAAQHVRGLPGAESDLCGDLLAAVWLDRAGDGDLGRGRGRRCRGCPG
jgi:hypothetical protein